MKINGFDKVQKELDKLQKNAERLNGTNEIPFDELFTASFMTKYTKFGTINNFFDATPFDSSNLDEIDESELDVFVQQNTTFPNWQEMLGEASEIWTKNQLFS